MNLILKIRRIAEPVLLVLVGAGLFPIVNFNRYNPVEMAMPLRLAIIAFAAWACMEFGCNAHELFPTWQLGHTALLGCGLACAGLILRLLLELGEVSNTYNFTAGNVLFHVLFVTLLTAGAAWFREKK